jgi:hypothetical protein
VLGKPPKAARGPRGFPPIAFVSSVVLLYKICLMKIKTWWLIA